MGTMKPQFALSLSSDGISLLMRGTDGWHGLGTVGFGGDTMEADLAALRQRGAELTETPATDPLPVKLIIPEDQIRYLALDTGPLPLGSRRDAAATALEGATPYAVSELSFDIAAHGVTTHVAAVALETLQEAETFARAQGFAPLCYLATPEESAFVGEAFLGTPPGTDADVTAALKADRLPVRDLGPLPVKAPTLPAAPNPVEADTQAPLPLGLDVQVFEDSAPAEDAPTMGFSSRRAAAPPSVAAPDPVEAPAQPTTDSAKAEAENTPSEVEPETPAEKKPAEEAPAAKAPVAAAAQPASQPETPVMSAPTKAPDAAAKTTAPKAPEATTPAPQTAAPAAPTTTQATPARIPAAPSAPKSAPAPQFTRQGAPVPPPAPPAPAPKTFAAAVAAASSGAVIDRPAPKRKPAVPAALASALGATAKPVARPVPGPDSKPAKSKRPPLNAKHMLLATAALVVVLGGALTVIPALLQDDDTAESPSIEAEIALDTNPALIAPAETPFADNPAKTDDDTTIADGGIALQDPAAPTLIASLPAPRLLEVEPTAEVTASETLPDPVELAEDVTAEDTAIEDTVAPQVLSQAAQYAATGIWRVAPEISNLPTLVQLDGILLPQIDRGAPALTDSDLVHAPGAQSYDTDQGLSGIATASAVEPEPEPTQAPQIAATEPAPDEAELAADAQIFEDAATEIAQAEETPTEDSLLDAQAEVAETSDTTEVAEATEPAAPSAPARDARGLIIATTDGVLAPEGFMIYQGRPDIVPPAVPDRLDAEDLAAQRAAQAAEELRRELGRIRPRMRPASLTRTTEAAEVPEDEAVADIAVAAEAALDQAADTDIPPVDTADAADEVTTEVVEDTVAPTPRPRLRPSSLNAIARAVAEANTAPDAQVTPTVASATLRPRARPTNFEALLRRSREQATVRNTRAASVAPTIPSSASVARQATQTDVLNLRRLNLIGVYGTASNRRALVRLPSGRYVKVKVGDRIDGGKIVAIGQDQLRYQKGSRSTTLRMPSS